MTEQEVDNGTFIAAWAELVNSNTKFIVPADKYDVRDDARLLIPFIKGIKIGLANRKGEIVVEPSFDVVNGNCYSENEYIHVGVTYSYAYERKNRNPEVYTRQKWGLIDYTGKLVLPTNYSGIIVGDKTFIVREAYGYGYQGRHAVLNKKGETIVPFGVYSDIDPFEKGLSRVRIYKHSDIKREEWCGIINEKGEIILECKHRNILPFYGKYYQRYFKYVKEDIHRENPTQYIKQFGNERESKEKHEIIEKNHLLHYREYMGTYAQDIMGYDDETINDAFDGEPDAYWNID